MLNRNEIAHTRTFVRRVRIPSNARIDFYFSSVDHARPRSNVNIKYKSTLNLNYY